MKHLKKIMHNIKRYYLTSLGIIILLLAIAIFPITGLAADATIGEKLFTMHCSGCHVNGGNIVRRGKNLKLSALKRNGLDNPNEIARIAREGIGIMGGYEQVLGPEGDQVVANWIWQQAQNAWIHG